MPPAPMRAIWILSLLAREGWAPSATRGMSVAPAAVWRNPRRVGGIKIILRYESNGVPMNPSAGANFDRSEGALASPARCCQETPHRAFKHFRSTGTLMSRTLFSLRAFRRFRVQCRRECSDKTCGGSDVSQVFQLRRSRRGGSQLLSESDASTASRYGDGTDRQWLRDALPE